MSRIVASGHSSPIVDRPLLCCVSFGVCGRSTQSSARKEISSAKRGGGSQGGWKTDLGPSTKAEEEESGLKGGKGGRQRRREGMNQRAPLPFVVQMSPVTVKGRAGPLIGGAGLNCKVHSGAGGCCCQTLDCQRREEGGRKARQGQTDGTEVPGGGDRRAGGRSTQETWELWNI